jgi:phage-related protein
LEAGFSLHLLQPGERLTMHHSRAMPAVGRRCHELRVNDLDSTWRIVYRIDPDAIVIAEVFQKKTGATPKRVISACKKRIEEYDDA